MTKLGKGTSISLQEAKGRRWVSRAVTKAKREDGGFRLKWKRKGTKAGKVALRITARQGKKTVRSKRVKIGFSSDPALKTTAPVLTPRAKSVTAAPAPGAAGKVRLSEPIEAARGDVVAFGVGPKTPYGMLAKITKVKHRRNGSTSLSTRPVALIDVLPSGSINTKLSLGNATTARRGRRAIARTARAFSCTNGRSIKLTADASLSQSFDFEAEWRRLSLQSAELTGDVTVTGSVALDAEGSVSCELASQEILNKTFPPVTVPGPLFPIVLVPRAHVSVSGSGSVTGQLAAGISGSLTASAGIGYSNFDVYSIGGVTPAFSSQPPTASFKGNLTGTLSPSFEVLFYGIAGPELEFSAGADLSVTGVSPACYTLTAPFSLIGRINIPALNVISRDLTIWSATSVLAQAPMPPARCGQNPPPPPPPGPGPPPPPGVDALDPTFSGDGRQTTDFGGNTEAASAVEVQTDGKVVVAGFSNDGPANTSGSALARYDANGTLDMSFSGDGKLLTDTGSIDDSRGAMALQPDGKIIVAGHSEGAVGADFALDRYNANGMLDNSFSDDGQQTTDFFGNGSEYGRAVAVQPDGKIVVAGNILTDTSASYDFALARYNADGTLDSSFSGDGKQTTDFGGNEGYDVTMALQPNGKIVVTVYSVGATSDDSVIARYNADGTLDSSFSGDGKQTTGLGIGVRDVALQADGKIVLASDFMLVRFNAGGTLDTSFSGDGRQTPDFGEGTERAWTVALQTDGKIVLAGTSTFGSGASQEHDFGLARYSADGTLDTSFSGDGRQTTDFFGSTRDVGTAVALQANGRIVVAGSTGAASDTADDFALARYTGGS